MTPILARKCLEQLWSVRDNVAGGADVVESSLAQDMCTIRFILALDISFPKSAVLKCYFLHFYTVYANPLC